MYFTVLYMYSVIFYTKLYIRPECHLHRIDRAIMPKKGKKALKMASVKKRKISVGPDAQAEVPERVEAHYNPTDLNPEPLPMEGVERDNPLMVGEGDRKECGPDTGSEDEMDDGAEVSEAGASADNPLEVDDTIVIDD
jgi:hypothetical protein